MLCKGSEQKKGTIACMLLKIPCYRKMPQCLERHHELIIDGLSISTFILTMPKGCISSCGQIHSFSLPNHPAGRCYWYWIDWCFFPIICKSHVIELSPKQPPIVWPKVVAWHLHWFDWKNGGNWIVTKTWLVMFPKGFIIDMWKMEEGKGEWAVAPYT